MARTILVVDDDKALLALIRKYLMARGYGVLVSDNGSQGLMLVREVLPDLILVDAKMPDMDGNALCRMLKKEAATRAIPVVIMSGEWIADADVLAGFAGGADDYIAKPFALPVMAARLDAVLRRYKSGAKLKTTLKRVGLELDPAGRTVKIGGKPIALTRKEFDLLAVLLEKAGRLLSVGYLLQNVWNYDPSDYTDPGTVEVHVSHLRKKLGPKLAKRLVNVTGHGYKFES